MRKPKHRNGTTAAPAPTPPMNVLITGFPGMGKTTIASELTRRGYNALDAETIPGLMHTVSRLDGRPIQKPYTVPIGWYDTIGAYIWDPRKMTKLLSSRDDIIICSKSHNQEAYYHLFDLILVLTLDSDNLARRLTQRPGKNIGKTADEAYDILRLHEQFERTVLRQPVAVEVNTDHTLDETLNMIIRTIDSHRPERRDVSTRRMSRPAYRRYQPILTA